MARQVFSSTAKRSLLRRVFISISTDLAFHGGSCGGAVVEILFFADFLLRRAAVVLKQLAGGRLIFLAHQNDGAADGQNVLGVVHAANLRVDAGGIQQAFDDQGFRVLVGVENGN